MSQPRLTMYDPDGYFYGFPYWEVGMDYLSKRVSSYGSLYLEGLVRTREHPDRLIARYMRQRDIFHLEGC